MGSPQRCRKYSFCSLRKIKIMICELYKVLRDVCVPSVTCANPHHCFSCYTPACISISRNLAIYGLAPMMLSLVIHNTYTVHMFVFQSYDVLSSSCNDHHICCVHLLVLGNGRADRPVELSGTAFSVHDERLD